MVDKCVYMHYNVYTNLKGDIPMNKEFYEINSAEYEEALEILCEIAEEDEDEDEIPDDYNDELGFNPYMGCYDFDC